MQDDKLFEEGAIISPAILCGWMYERETVKEHVVIRSIQILDSTSNGAKIANQSH